MSKVEPEKDWKAGQHCRAIFSEDSCEYEATIIEILKDENAVPYADVEFVGYLNRDCCWMEQLMESKGEEARKKQAEDAGMEFTTGTDAIENSGKQLFNFKNCNTKDFMTDKNNTRFLKTFYRSS